MDQRLAGQYVTLQVHADEKALVVRHRQQERKRLPLKGLQGAPLSLEDYVAIMQQQAARGGRRCAERRAMP